MLVVFQYIVNHVYDSSCLFGFQRVFINMCIRLLHAFLFAGAFDTSLCVSLLLTIMLTNDCSAIYDERTSGPLSTWSKPNSNACCLYRAKVSGCTYSTTSSWAARIFKTRTLAAEACKNNRVSVNGVSVKPSHVIKPGETIDVKKPPITYSFKVLKTIEQRVGAKFVPQIYENVTDAKQYELLEMSRISGFVDRARGTGRPTKKDRRSMDAFVRPALFGWDEDDKWDEDDDDNQQ